MDIDPEFSENISSPGLGTTEALLSVEPLATEGEATSGPDDEVNMEELADADIGGGMPMDTMDVEVPESFELPELDF